MADADENAASNSARSGASSESASGETSREDTSKRLPAEPKDSVPAGEGSAAGEDAPVEGSFAEEAFAKDVAGAEDFSEKALSGRTRKAYRRAWADFLKYCDGIGKAPRPARPVTVAAYINNRARARPTDRGAALRLKPRGPRWSDPPRRLDPSCARGPDY